MAFGLILLYVVQTNKEALQHWHSEVQKIPGVVTIRKLSATDSVDQSKPYRDSYNIEVEETNLTTEEILRPLMAAAGSAISKWDLHLYRQISAEAKNGIDLRTYPPTNTELIQVGMSPTPESVGDYHAWFDEEHLEMLAEVPGWRTGHRYELIKSIGDGDEMALPFMSAHTYAEENGLGGEIWRKSIETPWTKKFLGLISDIAEVTARYEPQNRAYCWFRRHGSLSNLDGVWICGFECYENEAALAEVHRNSPEYKAMRKAVAGENLLSPNSPLIFSQPAADWGFLNLSGKPIIHFATAKEALVVVTTYTTKDRDTTSTLLDRLSKISDAMRQQAGVFAYYPLRRLDQVETEITIFQGYKSVHAYLHVTAVIEAKLVNADAVAEKTETTFWGQGIGHIR